MTVLSVKNVSKTYSMTSGQLKRMRQLGMNQEIADKRLKALDDVSFQLEGGEILGLLGPNGAGKSTIIKIITTLISADSGSVTVCECDIKKDRQKALENIGAVIEIPEMTRNISGFKNLKYLAKLQGGVGDERIRAIAKLMDLENRLDDKVANYSLGMKQRLGIIQAIMHNPKLLLLDEPTNGLDPQGIIDMRNLIKNLAKEQGMAIIVSSHNLAEIENLADRVIIINKGKKIADGEVSAIQNKLGAGKTRIHITCDNTTEAGNILANSLGFSGQIDGSIVTVFAGQESIAEINKELVLGGVNVYGVSIEKPSLEELFTTITASGQLLSSPNSADQTNDKTEVEVGANRQDAVSITGGQDADKNTTSKESVDIIGGISNEKPKRKAKNASSTPKVDKSETGDTGKGGESNG